MHIYLLVIIFCRDSMGVYPLVRSSVALLTSGATFERLSMKCTYCGREAEWFPNKEVYGKNYGSSYMIWLCRSCDAYVGFHNNTRIPKGSFANRELRATRRAAHSVIDPLWQSGKYKRKTVYIRLEEAFGEPIHVGTSDVQRCRDIIKTAKLVFQR